MWRGELPGGDCQPRPGEEDSGMPTDPEVIDHYRGLFFDLWPEEFEGALTEECFAPGCQLQLCDHTLDQARTCLHQFESQLAEHEPEAEAER